MKRTRKPTDKEFFSGKAYQQQLPAKKKPATTNQKEKQAAAASAVAASLALQQAHQEQLKSYITDWHVPSVTLSIRDKAPQLMLSEDQMTCKGAEVSFVPLKRGVTSCANTYSISHNTCFLLPSDDITIRIIQGGYRMARATHGVHLGAYYWECMISSTSDPGSHVRLGWSIRQGDLQAPVGYDRFSFGYRDISGNYYSIAVFVKHQSIECVVHDCYASHEEATNQTH